MTAPTIRRRRRPLAWAAFSAAVLAATSFTYATAATSGADVTTLELTQPIERQLTRGEEHRFQLALKEREYAGVVVEQRGVDVIVEVRGPKGGVIADYDDEVRKRGQEQVDLVADPAGVYTIVIKAAPGTVVPGSYAITLDSRRTAREADRSMQAARRLRTSAERLDTAGKFDEARLLLEHALTVTEHLRGPDDMQVAAVAIQLAGVYRKIPDSTRSESLYGRAIAIMERTLGSDHPATAYAWSQLALLYQHEGDRRKSEVLLRRSLDVIEKTLGSEHPWFVNALTTLGNLRDDARDLDDEESIIRRALAISEKIENTNSMQYASLLNNLGEVYRQKQDYAHAEEALRRSLALGEMLLGPDNYSVATPLQNLGIVARERRDYPAAIAYNTRALEIRERAVGPDHPDVAHILTNLGNIYRSTGDIDRALENHLKALHIWETAAGPYQQATLVSVGNIAKTYTAAGDIVHAIMYQQRADMIVEKELALNLAIGSERQKVTFVRSVSGRTDRTLSLHLLEAPDDADASALAALVLLQRKGRVLDAMMDTFATARQRAGTSDQELRDRLNAATAELARLVLNPPAGEPLAARRNAIRELERRKEGLEAEFAERSAEFRAQMQPVTLDAVQKAMPADAALLEFAIFRPFNPKAAGNSDAYGPPHYACYVLRKASTPQGVDLGDAATIDAAVATLRQALRDPKRTDLKDRARAVDRSILQPLLPFLTHATRLLISPDGELNLCRSRRSSTKPAATGSSSTR